MADLDILTYDRMTKQQLIDELHFLHRQTDCAEDGLKACEKRYREIFDKSPVCVWVEDWSAAKAMLDDLAGQGVADFRRYFQERPDALTALYKLPQANLISGGVLDIYGAAGVENLLDRWNDLATEDELNGFLETALSFRAGETKYEYEAEERKCDGTPIHVITQAMVLPDRDRAWSRVIISTMDITARKQAEFALQESEARLRSYFDNAPTAISLKDLDGQFMLINPVFETALGMSNEDVHGKTAHDVFPLETSDYVTAREREVIETGKTIEWEQEVIDENGAKHWLLTKFPVRDAAGTINGIGSISTDITELKRAGTVCVEARETAEMANRSKSEFLANMSHELRTPLNAIIGFSHIMASEMLGSMGNRKYLEYAEDIHNSGAHLLELINDILDISKIETGQTELIESQINVGKAVQACLNVVNQRAEQGEVSLHYNFDDNLPDMFLDERKLKQILTNLLSNAIKFTPPKGSVSIKAWSSPGDGYVIQVIDTGIGIALADIPKVLAPFHQIDSALNRKYEGAGLGLSLSKALAELHGGSLGLESEVGAGTTVTVRFPRERVVMRNI